MLQEALRWLGFGLCHQLPERSFFGGGLQVPVCARDTGIYVGFVVALMVLAALHKNERPSEVPPPITMVLMGVFVAAMAIDGVTSYAGLRSTTNEIRLATGLMTGVALATFVVPLLNGQLWSRSGPGRVLGRPFQLAVLVAALVASYPLVLWVLPAAGMIYPLLVAMSIVATFTAVNLVVVCLVPAFERRYDRLRDAWLPVLIALMVTLMELIAAAAIRAWLLQALVPQ